MVLKTQQTEKYCYRNADFFKLFFPKLYGFCKTSKALVRTVFNGTFCLESYDIVIEYAFTNAIEYAIDNVNSISMLGLATKILLVFL